MEKFALSDSVYLKALLVDPSRARRGAEPNIVGYRFHATRDLPRVPDFGTTGAFSLNNLYDYANQDQWRTVNAGEDFDLTLYELIIFASLPEISCSIDGQNPDINVEQHLSVVLRERGGIPAVKLAPARGSGFRSVRSTYPKINVLTCERIPLDDAVGAVNMRVKRNLAPEFEGTKFAPLALRRGPYSAGSARTPEERRRALAEEAANKLADYTRNTLGITVPDVD